MVFITAFAANAQFEKKNCSRAIQMLNAALLIDPENNKVVKTIIETRDRYVKEMISRLELDIRSEFPCKYKEAEKLILSNQLIKAGKMVEEIFNEEPKIGKTYFIKGLSLYMAGSLKEALKHFLKATELDESLETAKKMLEKTTNLNNLVENASKLMESKDYEKTVETLTQALSVDRENRVINQAALFQRSLAYFNMGESQKAFEDYKRFEVLQKLVGDVLEGIEIPAVEDKHKDHENDEEKSVEQEDKDYEDVAEEPKDSETKDVSDRMPVEIQSRINETGIEEESVDTIDEHCENCDDTSDSSDQDVNDSFEVENKQEAKLELIENESKPQAVHAEEEVVPETDNDLDHDQTALLDETAIIEDAAVDETVVASKDETLPIEADITQNEQENVTAKIDVVVFQEDEATPTTDVHLIEVEEIVMQSLNEASSLSENDPSPEEYPEKPQTEQRIISEDHIIAVECFEDELDFTEEIIEEMTKVSDAANKGVITQLPELLPESVSELLSDITKTEQDDAAN